MSDEEGSSPLEQQKPFGAGISRRTIHFVPAAVATTQPKQLAPQTTHSISPGDRYLNIVFKNNASTEGRNSTSTEVPKYTRNATLQQFEPGLSFCEVCNFPINAHRDATSPTYTNHESSIAHMVCLTHSHPPSYLNRSRRGLKYLSLYGWDPDSRKGLGATGEGIRAPIKAKVKNDTVGLGVKFQRNKKPSDTKAKKLDAKQVRKKEMEDRKQQERLQEMFYRNDDVEKYLGGG